MHMCAKIGASRYSHLFVVHNRTFRYRMNVRTNYVHNNKTHIIKKNRIICIIKIPASIIAYRPFHRNGVKKNLL